MSQPQQTNWWGRNWKWFVPSGCFLLLATPCLLCTGVLGIIFASLKNSWAYEEGLALARRDPQVIAALGEPIEVGWSITGNVSVKNDGGNASFRVPISGPKGSGILHVEALRASGQWHFEEAEVLLDAAEPGVKKTIDLLLPEQREI